MVHSSNLCTEITLNTCGSEIAVCNLGSVNLAAHIKDGRLDQDKLKATVATAMRMLDNVIDINYYAVDKARNSNFKHRPVGLGIMGFQDCLHLMRVPYASKEAVEFADRSMEAVAYYAYWASTELAEERGPYSTFEGSLWHRGILPQDSARPAAARSAAATSRWTPPRPWTGAACGRASGSSACATPTASPSRRPRPSPTSSACRRAIEPTYQNLYVKSNLSGEFTVANEYLVADLKRLNLWDEVMVADLKYFDGSLAKIDRIPPEIRSLYATAFEVDPTWLVEAGARRQKWIDQAQSLNIYMGGRVRQEAGRDLQAGLAARPQDHLLPAHAGRDARGEVDGQERRAQRGAGRRRTVGALRQPVAAAVGTRAESRSRSSARSTIRLAKLPVCAA